MPVPRKKSTKTPAPKGPSRASGNGSAPRGRRAETSVNETGMGLVIVESPAKARTIAPFLGRDYSVRASLGHVRDLPKSQLGVATDQNFQPKYMVPAEKKTVVDELRDLAKKATTVYLATDPDREGEAISWHLIEAADIKDVPIQRVVFHEITPEAIKEAFAHPRQIDMDLVIAQQARRILDRLVGYSLSPVLWRKVRKGLSAGRVQSGALRMIVEREREIENFVPQEYWSLDADLAKLREALDAVPARTLRQAQGTSPQSGVFKATLQNVAGKRGKIQISNQAESQRLVDDLRPAAYKVASVSKKTSNRQPEPPFTTSTLQQEASRKLNFTAQRTMSIAQQLYEGLDGGEGTVGLITYMRTDSVRVADVAIEQTRQYIQRAYGGDFIPGKPRVFTTRSKGAQEAHEGIRPTATTREPAQIRSRLSQDQYRLYDLIWKRMVASQMAAAALDSITVDVDAKNETSGNAYILRATNTQVTFPGYQILYSEGKDETNEEEERNNLLPPLAQDEPLNLRELDPKQHFTQPPPRYNDATLVKALEANGIGRPSTYAATLSTIQARGYVQKEKRQFLPQEIGYLVNDLLTEHFPEVVDIGFTARMEDELDDIAAGKLEWVPVLRKFYDPFSADVARANVAIPKIEFKPEPTGELCEKCGKPMVYRLGRFGRFMACSGFPNCRNAKPILDIIGVKCPKDGGEIVAKRTKRGRVFYGCANFPECDFTSWEKPLPEPCPNCGGLLVQGRGGAGRCTLCEYTAEAPARNGSKRPARELAAVNS